MRADLPEDEFKVLRQQTGLGLMISAKEPSYVADRKFRRRCTVRIRTAHGHGRAGRPPADRPTSQGLVENSRATGRGGAVQSPATASRGHLQTGRESLGRWKSEDAAPQLQLGHSTVAPTRIYLVDQPGSVQSQIRVGHLGVTRAHPDYHAVRVVSQILGGGFNSRLNEAIRVKRGLTYGAGGGFSVQRFAGQFLVSTFSKTPKTATTECCWEVLNEMRSAPPTTELDNTLSYLAGSFAGQRETPQATVGDLWLIDAPGCGGLFPPRPVGLQEGDHRRCSAWRHR